MRNLTITPKADYIKIGNKEIPYLDYQALIPKKEEIEVIVIRSEKIKLLLLNENKRIADLGQKSENILTRQINVLKQEMEMAFLERNIEGYLQSQIMYWQVFTALTFPNEKTTLYCDEIRKMINLNN